MSYLLVFGIGAAVTFLIVPTIRYVALRYSIIDRKGTRKIHSKVVTRFGGFAMYVGFVFALGTAYIMGFGVAPSDGIALLTIVIASTLMLFLGIYDDAKGANAFVKFSVQILGALLLIKSGIMIRLVSNPFGFQLALGVFAVPVTILWLVGVTNAINLIDGLDGLAAGIVFINAITLFFIYVLTGYVMPAFFAAALAGACIGFLPYNIYPARIFMGDTGSLFLGFALASLSIFTGHKASAIIGLLIPIVGLAVPILDTSLAFTRRILRGQSPFKADKEHIHHWLLSKKIPDKDVVITLWAVTIALNLTVLLIYGIGR